MLKEKMNKSFSMFLSALLLIGAIMVPFLNATLKTVQAAQETTTNVVIHKLQYDQGGTAPSIVNDGSILSLPTGVEAYDKAKYGDVSFTLVDITAYEPTKPIDTIQQEISALTQSQYNDWITQNGTIVATKSVDANGEATFSNVPSYDADGNHHVYAIFETSSSSAFVSQIAQPIVIALPMVNDSGTILSTVNLYPKNEVKDLELTLVKYGEAMATGSELAGAEFQLYSGTPGSGTLVSNTVLTTNSEGVISITGLTINDYYLVEIKAPDGYLINPNAQNNSFNKLTFSVTESGITSTQNTIKLVNYKKPDSEKTVENGTSPSGNNSSFSIGDLVQYKNSIYVPTDIMGGTVVDAQNNTQTTSAYRVFNYKDVGGTGLTYTKARSDLTVAGVASDSTTVTLVEGTDYTYTDVTNGFVINFIMSTGTVSTKVASLASGNINVSYKMAINDDAKTIIESGNGLNNSFDLSFNNNPDTSIDDEHIKGDVPVYTGGAKFIKEDSRTSDTLAGAEFVIKNSDNEYFNGWQTDSSGNKTIQWVATQPTSGDGVLISGTDGTFEIFGLPFGTYTLVEIKAPDGYTLPAQDVTFEITKDSYITVNQLVTVKNFKKPSLPITGSALLIGSIILGLLLIGAAVIYYRKRTVNE